MPLSTISPSFELPTSTAVLSISNGASRPTVFLPPVNDVAKSVGSVLAGMLRNGGSDPDVSHRAGAPREEVDDIAIDGRRLSTDHIVLPRDGKFSVVVVGSSMAEEYPETPESGRIAWRTLRT